MKGFTINLHGGHLGHVTSIILLYFHFHVPKSSYKIGQKWPSGFLEKHVLIFICS